jgi:hypothetical protein
LQILHEEAKMRLRYENTANDFVAFNAFHLAQSPSYKRSIAIYTCVFGLATGLAVFFLAKSTSLEIVKSLPEESKILVAAVQAILVVAIYALLLPRVLRRSTMRQARKLLAEGQNKLFLCEHRVEITDDGLVTWSPYGESRVRWEAVERVQRTEPHTFLYVSAVAAFIIPHDRILEGDCEAFVAEIQRRIELNKTGSKA